MAMDYQGLLGYTEDDKRQALNTGLMAAGAGLLGGQGWGNAAMGGLLNYQQGLQGAQAGRLQQMKMAQLLQQMQQEDEDRRRKMEMEQRRQALISQLPQEQQQALGLGLDYSKIWERANPAPEKPQLVEVADPNDPLRTVKQWMRPGETNGQVVGYGQMPEILDPRVQSAREKIARAGSSRQTTIVNPAMDPFKNEKALRDELNDLPQIKAAQEMDTAFKMIETARNNPSAANDLAMATKYMKILDPTSVVRESEFAMAVNATGLMDKVLNYANMVATGERLNPKQREDFYNSAKAINDAFQKGARDTAVKYRGIAGQYGLKPDNVTIGMPQPGGPGARFLGFEE